MREVGDLSALVFFEGMQSHSTWQPPPDAFEQWLKLFCLFHRGVVVADSDVNNHPLLNALVADTDGRAFLAQAIAAGCLRRAARRTDAGVMTQRDLFRQLRERSPERAAEVHPDTPGWMDDALGSREEVDGVVPWKLSSLAEAFQTRLMAATRAPRGLSIELQAVAADIFSYARDLPDGALSAAKIEERFRLRDADRAGLRQRVHAAYTGNLPAAFDGRLISAAAGEDIAQALPAGPDAAPAEQDVLAAWYESRIEQGHTDGFTFQQERLPASSAPAWRLDLEALMASSFEQIVDLREGSAPDRYFSLRHTALGSPAVLESVATELLEERHLFLTRLERSGRIQFRRSLDRKPASKLRLRPPPSIGQRDAILAGVVVAGLGEFTSLVATETSRHSPEKVSLRRTNTRVLEPLRRRLLD